MKKNNFTRTSLAVLVLSGSLFAVTGCGSSSDDAPPPATGTPPPTEPTGLVAFAPNGNLDVDVTWTDYGVPYVKADNMESLGFGVGFAFAQDNLCILADQIVKFNSQRALLRARCGARLWRFRESTH